MTLDADYFRERRVAKRARGECLWCRRPAARQALCLEHTRINRERDRARQGTQPWRPGRRGRPPLEVVLGRG